MAENIPASEARKTIDVSSLYVTPGLVDMHEHVFSGSMNREYLGENCVRADSFSFRSGVTTVVDAGCSGWRNFGEFRDEVINRRKDARLRHAQYRGHGMGGRPDVEQNTSDMDPVRRRKSPDAMATSWSASKWPIMRDRNGSRSIAVWRRANWPISR